MKSVLFVAAAALAIPAAPAMAQDADDYVTYTDADGRFSVQTGATFRTSDGVEENVEFDTDGVARISSADGTTRNARYTISNDTLCLDEDDDAFDRCYGYSSSLFDGTTYRVTDTRGITSDVTFATEDDDDDGDDRNYMSATYGERG